MNQKEIIKLGLILLLITAITGLILGGVHNITKAPIEKQIEKEKQAAMSESLRAADKFEQLDITTGDGIVKEINTGKNNGEIIGYAIKVETKGYSGPMSIMVGIGIDGVVEGIRILEQHETPGLGANAVLPAFRGQYSGKSTDEEIEVVKTNISKKNQIVAITGSTITSKAVTLGVNEAIKAFKELLKGGQK